MAKLVGILIVALFFEAVGVVLLSKGLKALPDPSGISAAVIWSMIKQGVASPLVLTGVLFEAIFFGALLYLMKQADLSLIWPLTSLGFVLSTLSAKLVLHEQVSATRWAGVALIVCGAALVSYSEKAKPALESPPAVQKPLP